MRMTLTWLLLISLWLQTPAMAGSSIGTVADTTPQPKQPPANHEPITPPEPAVSNKPSLFTTKTVIILAASTLITAGLGVGILHFLVQTKDPAPADEANLPPQPEMSQPPIR